MLRILVMCGLLALLSSACSTEVRLEQSMETTLHQAHEDLEGSVQRGRLTRWKAVAIYVGMVGDAYRLPFTNELQALAVSLDEQTQKGTISDEEAADQLQKGVDELNARLGQQDADRPGRVWTVEGGGQIATKKLVVHNSALIDLTPLK